MTKAATSCAFRGRRPLVPVHGDHLFRSMTTRWWCGEFRAPLGLSADVSVRSRRQGRDADCDGHFWVLFGGFDGGSVAVSSVAPAASSSLRIDGPSSASR